MATIDIFKDDAFSMVTLTEALNQQEFQPTLLRSMNIFTPKPVRTEKVAIERRQGKISILQTSERGAPIEDKGAAKRDIRDFRTRRIAEQSTIYASELADIRAFGSETELQQVQAEVADRLNGPFGIMRDIELTWERMMLGGVQGVVYDADDTVIYDWFKEWGVQQDAVVEFNFGTATAEDGYIKRLCNKIVRQSMKGAGATWVPGRTRLVALCGDNFYDDLTTSPETRSTYLNQSEAKDLRDGVGDAYDSFTYGGITWINYRGTDDGKVGIDSDEAKFFPQGTAGGFQWAMSPGESFSHLGAPGKPVYAKTSYDLEDEFWAKVKAYSYILPVVTTPKMLQRGKRKTG